MKDGKLFFLLKQLTSEEFRGLKKAIISPFFNTNERLLKLYNALKPDWPEFTDSEKYRRKLFKKVYQGENFNIDKQYKLFTAFCRLTEEYLLFSDLRKRPLKLRKLKTELYAKRQIKPYFESEAKALASELKNSPYRDLEYYESEIFLNNVLYFNPLKDKYDLKDQSLDNLVDALDHYFVLAKMRYGISVKNRERILDKPGIWRFQTALKTETDFLKNSVLFKLYSLAFSMVSDDEDFDFNAYENLLFANIEKFKEDSRILFFSGLNYASRQVNQGKSEFSQRALNWFRFGLKKDLLIENGEMPDAIFSNIVTYGCREREFEWTQNYIDKFQRFLNLDRRKEVVSFNQGMWYFYKREYENVYSLWSEYPFSYEYAGRSRQITIRALFELFLKDFDYYDILISNIKAFENFIYRDKKYIASRWQPNINCIRILKKTAKFIINNKPKKEITHWLGQELNSNKKIVGKNWLKEKMMEMGQ